MISFFTTNKQIMKKGDKVAIKDISHMKRTMPNTYQKMSPLSSDNVYTVQCLIDYGAFSEAVLEEFAGTSFPSELFEVVKEDRPTPNRTLVLLKREKDIFGETGANFNAEVLSVGENGKDWLKRGDKVLVSSTAPDLAPMYGGEETILTNIHSILIKH